MLDESVHYGICTFNDVDFFCNHMNNARYMRELDFARIDFFVRVGAVKFLRSTGMIDPVWIGASTLRYRKPIYLFFPYRIRTRVAYWEDHDVYLDHRFETLHDGFVRALGFSKVVFSTVKVADVIKTGHIGSADQRPPQPDPALRAWIGFLSKHREVLHEELNISRSEARNDRNGLPEADKRSNVPARPRNPG